MASGFWQSLTTQSGVLATWLAALAATVAAIATVVLIRGLWLTKQSIEESKRASLFQLMHERFNAPNMRFARATFARTQLDRGEGGGISIIKRHYVPRQGWQIIDFLNQIGHLVETGRLNSEDVVLAYGTHVQLVGALWKDQLEEYFRNSHYKPFLDLYGKVETSSQPKAIKNDIDRFWPKAQVAFWESESALDPNARSEDGVAEFDHQV